MLQYTGRSGWGDYDRLVYEKGLYLIRNSKYDLFFVDCDTGMLLTCKSEPLSNVYICAVSRINLDLIDTDRIIKSLTRFDKDPRKDHNGKQDGL